VREARAFAPTETPGTGATPSKRRARSSAGQQPDQALGSGRPLEPGQRSRFEQGFGANLEHIRIHSGPEASRLADSASAVAVTSGRDIAFGSGEYRPGSFSGDLILAHEIAHALQYREGSAALSEDTAETSATSAGMAAASRMRGGTHPADAAGLPHDGLALRSCTRSNVQKALDGEIAWTPTLATQALDQYQAMSDSDRQRAFDRYYPTGAYARLLQALPPGAASGPYNEIVQDILRRAQRRGALESAAASGLTSEAAMAQAQATLMQQRNLAAASAALPSGAAPPTTAQVAAQQQAQVAQTSIAPSTSTLTPAQVTAETTRANTAVTTLISYAASHYPELGLTTADFHVDVVGIEDRGAGVIAYGETIGGRRVVTVGRPFSDYVDRSPAYAIGTVVHELRGHPEYGPYGQAGVEYGLTLYDLAAARMPGYTRPTGAGRTSEIDAYAYQETEIYSLLREVPYFTPLAPADVALPQTDPAPLVTSHVREIKQQWEPRIAKALLRGLYQRLRLDPRITAAALRVFENAVRANYSGADASTANDILR
jgi:hypothetical protein